MKTSVYLTGLLFAICLIAETLAFASRSCDAPTGWTEMEATKKDSAAIIIDLDASKITLGKPFTFKVALCGDESQKPDRITVDAIMPAHQHGMNYTPGIRLNESSKYYEVTDFLFHMPGVWEITVSGYRGEKVTHYTKKVTIN